MIKSLVFTLLILFVMTGLPWGESIGNWFNKGKDAYIAEKYDEAIKYFEKAIAINSMFPITHRLLGNAYVKKNMLDKAVASYKRAITIDPDCSTTHFDLAFVYFEKGMVDNAIAHYKKVLALDNNDIAAHFNLAICYTAKDMVDKAISHYKEILKINPKDARAYQNLGVNYYRKGLHSLAAENFCDAGLLFIKQGDREMALNAYEGLKIAEPEKCQDLYEKLQ